MIMICNEIKHKKLSELKLNIPHIFPFQLQAMESVFQEKQYPDVTAVTMLAERIGLQTEKVCVSHYNFHRHVLIVFLVCMRHQIIRTGDVSLRC